MKQDDEDIREVELAELSGGAQEESAREESFGDGDLEEVEIVNYRPAVRRQNRCFGTVGGCLLLAALVYFVAGALLSPAFGEAGGDEFDSGSGEVGIDVNNAKAQEAADVELSATKDTKGKGRWGHHPFSGWGKDRHKSVNAGQSLVHNKTYWEDFVSKHPGVMSKDKIDKMHMHKPDSDGLCTLMNGKKIPCGGSKPSIPAQPTIEDSEGGIENTEEAKDRQKVSLSDGKKFEVLGEFQHDPSSFTQGLTFHDGILFESTGLYGKSKVRQLDPMTGKVVKSISMNRKYFGEGMTYYDDDKLIQITWKSRKGFIYNATTLERISDFEFTTTLNEGWGITYDASDRTLIVSDGSEYLHFWDADLPGVDKKQKIKVKRQRSDMNAREMNELEFVNGKVLANVWYQDILLVIDPLTGKCEDEYDFSSLWPKKVRSRERADVLNGISVSGEDGVLFVTGKLWRRMFRVRLQ